MEAPGPTTQHRQAHDLQQALAESDNRFRCLIEYALDAYLEYDEDGRVRDANASACETYGYSKEELRGVSVEKLVDGGEHRAMFTQVDDELCGGSARTIEVLARRKEGSTFPAEVRVGLVESHAGRRFMALVRDITERKRSQEQIEYLGEHDHLTGLPNSRLFDDFGAGHSSLGRLSELPCEILKIDRSFVRRLPEDPSAAAMVTAILELARGLDLQVVAEGIETQGQLEFLAERQCQLGQGFLFSRPVPGDEVPRL